MMFIKKLDMLSPPITLYFKGEDQHQSIFSAILSIVSYLLVFAATIYYSLGFINKDNPKAYFFTRFIEDAGTFPVNSSSMFNYIQFVDKFDNTKLGFDFSVLRAVGVNSVYYDQYMDDPEVVSKESHWVYGPCNDDTDIKGIEGLIDPFVYKNSACIREYYNADDDKYYKTGEEGFIWPIIRRGCSSPNSTFYGIIIQRCDYAPNSLKHTGIECKTSEQISESITNLSLKFQLIDQYADVLNYKTPFTKYFYEVTSAVQDGIYIINHLNFNPANMLTHNGIFFDNQINERSYFFTQNEKHTIDETGGKDTNGCLIGIYFWMQNTLQHYERNYDKFQDLLSDIGGISNIIITLGYYFNLLINYYIALMDTEELIIRRDEINYGETRIRNKRPTFIKKVNQIENPPRRRYGYGQFSKRDLSSNNQKLNLNNLNDSKISEVDIYNVCNNSKTPYRKEVNKPVGNKCNDSNINNISKIPYLSNRTNNIHKENKNQENLEELAIKKHNFKYYKYIWYLISCKSNNKLFSYFENLRTSLISEENIIQNYLDIYKLLKINGIEKKDIFNNINW